LLPPAQAAVDQLEVMRVGDDRERPYADLPTTLEFSDSALAAVRRSDGAFVYVSDGFCALVGRTREDLTGRTPTELGLSTSERARWILDRAPEAGRAHRYWRTFPTPRGERPGEVIIHTVSDDMLVVSVAELEMDRDEAVPAEEGALGSIVDAVPLGVVVYDRELRIVRVNRVVEQMGRVRPEHLGQRVTDAFPEVDPAVVESIGRVLETGKEILNQPVSGPDGRNLLLNFFPIRGMSGAVEQVGCVFSDVTDVLAAQELIALQQESIRELSTPILELAEDVLVIPHLLPAIAAHRARHVIIDVTGVPIVDSETSHHLLQTAQAASLMGARTVFTGVSARHAATLATLGLDLAGIKAVGTLADAVRAILARSMHRNGAHPRTSGD
jgi:PAS domain S-box-containing protein